MGDSRRSWAAAEVDVWLRGSGRVVAASERAARAAVEDYHRARQAEGLTAWVAPQVEPWNEFVRQAWEAACPSDDRLVMNPAQEHALWVQVISDSPQGRNLLPGSLERMAKMAADGHARLCAYAPELLRQAARSNWQQDAGTFSEWLSDFDRSCASGRVVSAARLPLELHVLLQKTLTERQALLLVGFDRVQPAQEIVLKSWGSWRHCDLGKAAEQILFYEAPDEHLELKACALWCTEKLKQDKTARLMVVTQDLPVRRGEFERVFLQHAREVGSQMHVEFSLGVPLEQTPLARAAHLLMQWLTGSVEEHELDWLLGCGQLVANAAETDGLTGFMRALRRRMLERTHWRLDEFMRQSTGAQLPAEWAARIGEARRRLDGAAGMRQSPVEWAEFAAELLRIAGWPAKPALTSEEYQALRRWEHVLETCASLGFDGRRVRWSDFLETVRESLQATLYAPESQDASVVITGPAESAGLTADAIWLMGATEAGWPAKSSMHPLLPFWVQREFKMPHATVQIDWELAQKMTARLLGSAPEVCFSYARQMGGVEMRASKLAIAHGGTPQRIEPAAAAAPMTAVEDFEDNSRVALGADGAEGGSAVLSAQSQCPFKAFATARLVAEGWKPAEAGLNAMQRGNLLHEVLHLVWSPGAMRSLAELKAMTPLELRQFVNERARAVFESKMPAGVREHMPAAYLSLEEERLTNVVTEWLEFERTRAEFTVAGTEILKDITVAGLSLQLRLDRIDRLNDGSFLVIDYKSGTVSTKAWEMPRPEDVQLPLYAEFALDGNAQPLEGLVFARVQKGKDCFAGKVFHAQDTLLPGLGANTFLVKKPLTVEDRKNWRDHIERMARDFVAGRADVDPIDRGKTCERCGMQTLCRIDAGEAGEEDAAGEEAEDE